MPILNWSDFFYGRKALFFYGCSAKRSSVMLLCATLFVLPAFSGAKKDTYKPATETRSVAVVYSQEEQVSVAVLTDFLSYKSAFDRIMLSSMADCLDSEFSLAAKEFTREDSSGVSALTMGRERFLTEGFPRSAVSVTDTAISQARNSVAEIQTIQKRLENPYSDFVSAVKANDLAAAGRAYSQAERYLSQISSARQNVLRASESVKALYSQYSSDGSRDSSYLFSLSKVLAGLDGTASSGLCGVFDQLYDAYAGGMKRELLTLIDADMAKFFDSVNAGKNYQEAKEALLRVSETASLSRRIDSSSDAKLDAAISFSQNAGGLLDGLILYENLSAQKKSVQDSAKGGDILSDGRLQNQNASVTASLMNLASSFSTLQTDCESALEKSWIKTFPGTYWQKELSSYKNGMLRLSQDSAAAASELWNLTAQRLSLVAEAFLADDTELLNKAQSVSKNQPKDSLAALETLVSSVNRDVSVVESYKKSLSGHVAKNYIASLEDSSKRLTALLSESERLSKEASELTSRAYQAQLDGDTLYREAETAYSRKDYNTALEKLEAAAEKYDESLAIQEDESIRTKRNTTLLDLSNRIARAKYENIVREVRSLKDSATTLYYSGEFEAAEASLNRAEQLWTDITVEVDDELEKLKTLVNTALTMNIGRVLSTDDPLYPEMSQILSIANQYYSQGLDLKNKGNSAGAEEVLNLAKQKLEELQRVYPLNQAANILTLRINRLLDPVEFERSFESRMKVLSEVNYSARDALATQSYTELKDLYVINPSYPGIATLVSNAEIALGLKQKPVPVSTSQRAATVAREAQTLLSRAGTDENLLAQARTKAEEALELDPNNSVAKNVLDEVKLKSGSQDSGVLSSEDEEQFQRAKQLFKNNYIEEAYTVISALYAKNPSSKRIKNLKERIELKL